MMKALLSDLSDLKAGDSKIGPHPFSEAAHL